MLKMKQQTANAIPSVASVSTTTISGNTIDLNSLSGVPSNGIPSGSESEFDDKFTMIRHLYTKN